MDEHHLELGLALPSNPSSSRLVNLNSTTHVYSRSTDYNLMGSAAKTAWSDVADGANKYKNKRIFNEAFVQNRQTLLPPLPLLSWNDKPNDDGDDDLPRNLDVQTSCNGDKNGDVVGWPPINTWRRKLFYQATHDQGNMININDHMMGATGHYDRSNSMFVKVKMEGAAVGRKIDLSVHHSYQTLENALIWMFGHEGIEATKIVYQDKEGDWLLVGDVPWKNFIQSVQRLKILPNNN